MPSSADDLGVRAQDDRRVLFDAPNQIARHALGQTVRPDEHVHLLGGLREKHRGLTGGVSTAHHDHLLTAAHLRLDKRRPVVDTRAFEP